MSKEPRPTEEVRNEVAAWATDRDPAKLPLLDEDWGRALCIVAHPDDLEYGAASAVAKWTSAGKEVIYVLASRGEAGIETKNPGQAGPLREKEQRRSAEVVGVEVVEFLDHRDGQIVYGIDLRRDIARAIRRHTPDVIVTLNHRDSWGGRSINHADHRAVGWAVLDAVRDAANRWLYPELMALQLEPWDNVKMVLVSGSPEPTHAVDVTGHLEKGIESLKSHEAYLTELGDTDPAEMLTRWATSAGERAGCEHAVAFEVFEL